MNCLAKAFSHVLRCDNIYELIGHDGSEIIWPGLVEPFNRRAFHIQELINVAWKLGYSATPFETKLKSAPSDSVKPFATNNGLFVSTIMATNDGVAIGTLPDGRRHAESWINGRWGNGTGVDIEVFYVIKSEIKNSENSA